MATNSHKTTGSDLWHLEPMGAAMSLIQKHPVDSLPFLIGRGHNLSLSIPSPHVSKLHAIIFENNHALYLCDNGSTNGTYLNGELLVEEKSIENNDLIQFADAPFRVTRNTAPEFQTVCSAACDLALAISQFDRLLSEEDVILPHYQPIVRTGDEATVAYEMLGRSRLFGLSQPNMMFRTAAHLGMESDLSRQLRESGFRTGTRFGADATLFLNTHPRELEDVRLLIKSMESLRDIDPDQAVTIEIHESAAADTKTMRQIQRSLTELNMSLAYDDFGSGQSRLTELANVPPSILKFDITLIRKIHEAPAKKQEMLATLVRMTRELGTVPLAEGVECEDEVRVCRQLGFELFQGYYFGRPRLATKYLAMNESAQNRNKSVSGAG